MSAMYLSETLSNRLRNTTIPVALRKRVLWCAIESQDESTIAKSFSLCARFALGDLSQNSHFARQSTHEFHGGYKNVTDILSQEAL
jgi:hypothetical protein